MTDQMVPPAAGAVTLPHPAVRAVLAPNPSPMTFWGTNSFIVGTGQVAVIDPGPDDPAHTAAILAALGPAEEVSHILVTHAHLDHSPGARLLAARTGAQVHAFGGPTAGRSAVMEDLALSDGIGGGEGVDAAFSPDVVLADGETVAGRDWALTACWTPGHFGNHLCFGLQGEGVLFSGDLVMGWASSLVSPPDGDLTAFMSSLERLAGVADHALYLPGHGAGIEDPSARVAELLAHRRMRGAQIEDALANAPGTASELAARIYTDTPPVLLPAAARNVFAHLIDMYQRNEVMADGNLSFQTRFSRA